MPHADPTGRSDRLLEALAALKQTEARRHREPDRGPLFRALADEADAHRRRIFRIAAEPESTQVDAPRDRQPDP